MNFARSPLVFLLVVFCALALGFPSEAHSHHHRHHHDSQAARSDDSSSADLSGGYPHPVSHYAVLMDAGSGRVLYERNAYAHREPASLTKIATAIVLIENGRQSDTVVAPPGLDKVPESSLHLAPGEKISLHDLLYAMMLRSANDTPVAGAYYLCGGVAPFVSLMNQKVQEIGCSNTHFVTPNGLYDPNHYSCAYDLALMARYATLNLPTFNKIVKTQRYRVHRSIHTDDCLVVNTASKFLKTFPGGDGVKTGFISQAGHCFVGSATQNGWRLIAVSLDSNRCREDVEEMLAYGFKNYQQILAVKSGAPAGTVPVMRGACAAPVVASRALYDVIPKTAPAPSAFNIQVAPLLPRAVAPIAPGQKVGTLTVLVAGKPVATGDALAAVAVPPVAPAISSHLLHWRRMPGMLGTILLAVFAGLALLAITFFLGLVCYARALTKNSRRRRARLAQELRTLD